MYTSPLSSIRRRHAHDHETGRRRGLPIFPGRSSLDNLQEHVYASCRLSGVRIDIADYGQREKRPVARHTGPVDSENAGTRVDARLGHYTAYTTDVGARPAVEPGIPLSR